MNDYDDIIGLPHHVSATRRPMPIEARAAQFAPFAALSGHEAAINETARLTDSRPELSSDEQERLSHRLTALINRLDSHPKVCLSVFCPDSLKDGGRIVSITGRIRKVDTAIRTVHMTDGRIVCLDDIVSIDTPVPLRGT